MIALLGQRDQPTDGVRDYCSRLSEALGRCCGFPLALWEARWEIDGWIRALWALWRASRVWAGDWVLLQYTGLMWSRRGFPVGFLAVLGVLKIRRCKTAVTFHEIGGGRGHGLISWLRLAFQDWVMRCAHRWADRSVVTVAAERVAWLPRGSRRVAFIPVGPNVPARNELPPEAWAPSPRNYKTVVVFGVTGGRRTAVEVEAIAHAVRLAARAVPRLRLLVLGRGAEGAELALHQALNGAGVAVEIKGLLSSEQVSGLLVPSDVQVFVRGAISSGRGSAMAGIACGLPLVAYRGAETAFPITEAGVLLVPQNDKEALAQALTQVLTRDDLRQQLAAKSFQAYRRWFSWEEIAKQFLEALGRQRAGQPRML